jgi:hypothetical protein
MASCHSQVSLMSSTYTYSCSFSIYLAINKCVTAVKISNFSGHYLRNRWTLDIALGYTLPYGTPSRSLAHSSWDTCICGLWEMHWRLHVNSALSWINTAQTPTCLTVLSGSAVYRNLRQTATWVVDFFAVRVADPTWRSSSISFLPR